MSYYLLHFFCEKSEWRFILMIKFLCISRIYNKYRCKILLISACTTVRTLRSVLIIHVRFYSIWKYYFFSFGSLRRSIIAWRCACYFVIVSLVIDELRFVRYFYNFHRMQVTLKPPIQTLACLFVYTLRHVMDIQFSYLESYYTHYLSIQATDEWSTCYMPHIMGNLFLTHVHSCALTCNQVLSL